MGGAEGNQTNQKTPKSPTKIKTNKADGLQFSIACSMGNMILVSFKDMKMGTSWNCSRGGGSDWIFGKSSAVGVQAQEWAFQGSGHGPKLLEFKECLDYPHKRRV